MPFCGLLPSFLEHSQPDVILTYGGDPVSLLVIELAKKRGIPVVFALHNFSYTHSEVFRGVDYVIVPSEFARRYYWDTLGLACMKLPNVIDWQRVAVADRKPQFVTFVNPEPVKGVYIFARIAAELARRRPDIPLLVVEGRGQRNLLPEAEVDLRRLPNIDWLKNTADPRQFYRLTKLILMPSLWNESFGLVAVEAMFNGIPVLGSNRGSIPEVVGAGGFLFDIPACYTPTSQTIPSAEDVESWVETIVRLWDDERFYEHWSETARQEAERWRPDKVRADISGLLQQHLSTAGSTDHAKSHRAAAPERQFPSMTFVPKSRDPSSKGQTVLPNGAWPLNYAATLHGYSRPLADWIRNTLDPFQVTNDLGCGLGFYCQYLAMFGFRQVFGWEGTEDIDRISVFHPIRYLDLSQPVTVPSGQTICLEVGEHIPPPYEQTFLDNLARVTQGLMVLSWAIPGQGGVGHANERPNEYVITELGKRGFVFDLARTQAARVLDYRVCPWFRDTLLVFRKVISRP